MTPEHFADLLDHELRRRHARFNCADLLTFVAANWALIRDKPDVERWAREFLDRGKADVLA
jgi:hypothetical protein